MASVEWLTVELARMASVEWLTVELARMASVEWLTFIGGIMAQSLKQSVLIYGSVVASLGGLVAVVSISQKQTKRHVVPWSAFDRCSKAMSESIQDLDWRSGLYDLSVLNPSIARIERVLTCTRRRTRTKDNPCIATV